MDMSLNTIEFFKIHTWKLAMIFIFLALLNTLIFGFTHDNFYIQKWRVPELIMELQEERDFNQYKDLYIAGTYPSTNIS